ncbi:hypothetical protein [Desulfobacter sp.]
MDLIFLVSWTVLFSLAAFLIWRRVISRIRLYVMILLNLVFLAGLFYFYPMVLEMSGLL